MKFTSTIVASLMMMMPFATADNLRRVQEQDCDYQDSDTEISPYDQVSTANPTTTCVVSEDPFMIDGRDTEKVTFKVKQTFINAELDILRIGYVNYNTNNGTCLSRNDFAVDDESQLVTVKCNNGYADIEVYTYDSGEYDFFDMALNENDIDGCAVDVEDAEVSAVPRSCRFTKRFDCVCNDDDDLIPECI